MRAVAKFEVTAWDQSNYGDDGRSPQLSRASVSKEYRGDLKGSASAELLMCQADPEDLGAGAGYVASEKIEGQLGGREGTFVIQHWGSTGGGEAEQSGGYIVRGSGTGGLEGLSGDVQISVDDQGVHTLTLDFEI